MIDMKSYILGALRFTGKAHETKVDRNYVGVTIDSEFITWLTKEEYEWVVRKLSE
jgi:hypothetical protein